jgi:DMSO reductase family type II enzyme heme b subunit
MMTTRKLLCSAITGAVLGIASQAAISAEPVLNAVRIKGVGPILDVDSPEWKKARAISIPLQPQTVTTPTNPGPAVHELKVKAAHNGQWLAILIEWKDPTKNDGHLVVDHFGDQVAVELPIKRDAAPVPSPMMGNPGGRVNILQWRAAFQHDLEHGGPTIKHLYPNALIDLYPDQVLRASDARPYTGALGVDNPISRPKLSPVLDQMSEGWGSMTVKPDQHADGRGIWEKGVWRVVITTPMATESMNAPRLAPGDKTFAAFAVWDGGSREVGSRKAWSNWVPLTLSK